MEVSPLSQPRHHALTSAQSEATPVPWPRPCSSPAELESAWRTGPSGVTESFWPWKPQWPTSVVPATTANSTIYVAEVGVDASYVASGSDIANTIDMVEFSILDKNVPFLRDASILHKLGKLVIRRSKSKDPYPSTDKNVLLKKVRDVWNGELAGTVGRTQQVGMVSRPGADGGLAWAGTVATSDNPYSADAADANGDFSVIWRHEAGHNWGSGHFEGDGNPEGPTIMSGNALSRFSSSELLKILLYKARVPQPVLSSPMLPWSSHVHPGPARIHNIKPATSICECPG